MLHTRGRLIGVVAVLSGLMGVAWLAAAEKPADSSILRKVADFTLQDVTGKQWSLYQQQGKKAVVIVFLSAECPMSDAYLPPLAELAKKYEPKGVAMVAINANAGEDAKQIAAHAKEFGILFPVLRDEKHVAVSALKAEVNPEAFVLDDKFVLRYRGRIDDGYSARLKKNARVSRRDLQLALDEVLAGKPVTTPVTQAYGCPIQAATPPKSPPCARGEYRGGGEPQVTFNRDVMPILQNKCQTCHRPGNVAPFSLMTYKQAVKWGDDIKQYTQSRQMPPWKPAEHGVFRNERGLTDGEISTLARWVDSGMAEGNPKELPPPRKFVEGWTLGEPDLVLTVPEEMQIGPAGRDLFRVFVLPTHLNEDKHVTAVEVRPRNRRVVHHTLNFVVLGDQARKLQEEEQRREKKPDEQDRGPGYTVPMGVGRGVSLIGGLGGWAPGQVPRHLPEGVGYYLPKGADIALQVHYHRTGKVERDQTQIGLYFAKKPITHRFQATIITGRIPLLTGIPAGNDNFKVEGQMWIDRDITLYTVMPHMHLLGKEIKATMTLPDGTTKQLVWIKDWDYNWQETYHLKEPIKVPAGTKFEVVAFYDNSENNPLNPNSPPRPVRFGEQTTDEMCFVFLGATSDKPGRIIPRPSPPDTKAAKDGKP